MTSASVGIPEMEHHVIRLDYEEGEWTLGDRLEKILSSMAPIGFEVCSFQANDVVHGPALLIMKRPRSLNPEVSGRTA